MNKAEIDAILNETSPLTPEEVDQIDWEVKLLWNEKKGVQGVVVSQRSFLRLIASHKLLAGKRVEEKEAT